MSWYCEKCGNHNKYESRPCVKCGMDPPVERPAKKVEPKRSHKVKEGNPGRK